MSIFLALLATSSVMTAEVEDPTKENLSDHPEMVMMKKKALKKLFNKERKVPIIYNRNSKVFRKYLQTRLPRRTDATEEPAPITPSLKYRPTTPNPEYTNQIEHFFEAALEPQETKSKSVPGISLEQQLENLVRDLNKAGGIEKIEKSVRGKQIKRQNPEFAGYPRNDVGTDTLRGSFVHPEVSAVRQLPPRIRSPPPQDSQTSASTNSWQTTRKRQVRIRRPLVLHHQPTLKNVYKVDGVLYRKPVPVAPPPQPISRPDPTPLPSNIHGYPLPTRPTYTGTNNTLEIPQDSADIFGEPHTVTPYDSTLYRQAFGTTDAPIKKDKNIRFFAPEINIPPLIPTVKTTTKKPLMNLVTEQPYQPLPSSPEVVTVVSSEPNLEKYPVYYKPFEPETAPPVSEVYFKPLQNELAHKKPKALDFNPPILNHPKQNHKLMGETTPYPLIYGFKPVRFEDDPKPPGDSSPSESRPLPVLTFGEFRTVYQETKPVRFPSPIS